jgi:hypothetical protein
MKERVFWGSLIWNLVTMRLWLSWSESVGVPDWFFVVVLFAIGALNVFGCVVVFKRAGLV